MHTMAMLSMLLDRKKESVMDVERSRKHNELWLNLLVMYILQKYVTLWSQVGVFPRLQQDSDQVRGTEFSASFFGRWVCLWPVHLLFLFHLNLCLNVPFAMSPFLPILTYYFSSFPYFIFFTVFINLILYCLHLLLEWQHFDWKDIVGTGVVA